MASSGSALRQSRAQRLHARAGDQGLRQPEREGVAGARPGPRHRQIDARAMGKPRQQIARADIGKEPDADLGHGEGEAFPSDQMRAMRRNADAAAHDNAVDQRDIGLGIALDAAVEQIFLAPEGQLRGMIARPALIVEKADVAAGAEGAPARAA